MKYQSWTQLSLINFVTLSSKGDDKAITQLAFELQNSVTTLQGGKQVLSGFKIIIIINK